MCTGGACSRTVERDPVLVFCPVLVWRGLPSLVSSFPPRLVCVHSCLILVVVPSTTDDDSGGLVGGWDDGARVRRENGMYKAVDASIDRSIDRTQKFLCWFILLAVSPCLPRRKFWWR